MWRTGSSTRCWRRHVGEGLLSTEHFTVDGTLIEARASLKSLKRKDKDGGRPAGGETQK